MEKRRWEELQLDCLVNIFQKLSLDDLKLSVPFVCKQWYRASVDPSCYSVLNFRELDFMPWSNFTKNFMLQYYVKCFSFSSFMRFVIERSCGSVLQIMFPLIYGASVRDLDYASIKCPHLKVLALPENLMLEDDLHIPEIIGRWKELEKLEMESKPCSFKEIISEISCNCKNFKRLKVCGLISKEDASAIANCLPEINCLELSKSYLTKDEMLVIISKCSKLERLIVRDCLGFVADEEVLKMAAGIRTFEHQGSKLLDDFAYETDEAEHHQTAFFFW